MDRIGRQSRYMMTGGVAKNKGVVKIIENRLQEPKVVPLWAGSRWRVRGCSHFPWTIPWTVRCAKRWANTAWDSLNCINSPIAITTMLPTTQPITSDVFNPRYFPPNVSLIFTFLKSGTRWTQISPSSKIGSPAIYVEHKGFFKGRLFPSSLSHHAIWEE